ncbi:sensor histidine kinase [Streptomyces sporangiiformans]|uniref:histidine kinase n=1 Tax=Streptomyces sporangiiformans TaxID=2315329 RepID=A0A505DRU0_9ACTN|nr:histidine kinase [Streptomyces sporangiiformans]TPQ23977.1 two-component sensor histidine kinase [Streptomyces sporangiiformans]
MSPERAATAADTAQGTALAPSPGLDAAWAHPLLGRLLRDQSRRQRLDRRHPWLLDTAVVLIVVLISLPDLLSSRSNGPFGDAVHRGQVPTGVLFLFAAALIVPLWWRRRAPAVTFFVIALVSLVQWSFGVWQQAGIATLVALYSLALHGSLRVLGWAAAATVAEVTVAVCVLVDVGNPLRGLFFLLGTATAAIAVGLTLRIRRMYLAALEDRARRLEIEQDQRVQLTAAAERSRVAREMHDIVGHNLSVMVSVADGAATLATNNNERSAEALRILGDTGRQAMSELRRVLGVLREEQQDDVRMLSPQPGVGDLDSLLARVRAAGLRVTYRTVGDLDALGSGVQLTVYRIVQESLTNTLKHAGTGSAAEVTVAAESGTVRIRVADTGTPPEAPVRAEPGAGGPGHGLVGIRQRAAMYGGTVTIGPRDTGHGWIVDVLLDVPSAPILSASGEHLP